MVVITKAVQLNFSIQTHQRMNWISWTRPLSSTQADEPVARRLTTHNLALMRMKTRNRAIELVPIVVVSSNKTSRSFLTAVTDIWSPSAKRVILNLNGAVSSFHVCDLFLFFTCLHQSFHYFLTMLTFNCMLTGKATSVTVISSPSSINSPIFKMRLGRLAFSKAGGACMYRDFVEVRRLGFFNWL
jgi:hypothetical protein